MRDQAGDLVTTPPGILLFLHWPGTEPFPQRVDPPYAENGLGVFTEEKGSVGWGFGPDGGPFLVLVSSDPETQQPPESRRVGSDAVDRLGW